MRRSSSRPNDASAIDCTSRAICFGCLPGCATTCTSLTRPLGSATRRLIETSGSRQISRSTSVRSSSSMLENSSTTVFRSPPTERGYGARVARTRTPARVRVAQSLAALCHSDNGLIEVYAAGRAVEARVAERKDPAITRYQPVALAARGHLHPDDGLVEVDAAGRAVEVRVAEGEDAAVGTQQPIAVTGSRRASCRGSAGSTRRSSRTSGRRRREGSARTWSRASSRDRSAWRSWPRSPRCRPAAEP